MSDAKITSTILFCDWMATSLFDLGLMFHVSTYYVMVLNMIYETFDVNVNVSTPVGDC